jgi:hypothetical protein
VLRDPRPQKTSLYRLVFCGSPDFAVKEVTITEIPREPFFSLNVSAL